MFDLKQLRERANLTQSQLAKRLHTSQVQISRYEAAPGNLPINLVEAYLFALGLDLATEIGRNKTDQTATQIAIDQPYAQLMEKLSEIKSCMESLEQGTPELTPAQSRPKALSGVLASCARKPTLLLTGSFDAGKSHLGNYLLGKRYLPTGYQPETSIPIYVRHSSDRPPHIQEEVWIMDRGFNPAQWQNPQHCEAHKLMAGNSVTLNDWATHSGQHNSGNSGAALLFLDAPILHACQLVDIPGNLHSELDQRQGDVLVPMADLIIYTSPAKGFLNANDLIYLHSISQQVTSSDCLLVVATHADPSIGDKDLSGIIARGGSRLARELDNPPDLFSFWQETPARNEMLTARLQQLLSTTLPSRIKEELNSVINGFKEETKILHEEYQALCAGSGNAASQFTAQPKSDVLRQKIISRLLRLREESASTISPLVADATKKESIVKIIEEHYPDKREAQQYAAAHITNELQSKVSVMARQATLDLLPDIHQYVEDLNQPPLPPKTAAGIGKNSIPPNTRGFLFGSAAGLAGLGPLAAWASQLGPWGGYLVFANGATLLGLGGTGTAAVVSAVVSIGGPGVAAAAVVAAGAIVGTTFIGSNWKQRLAQKIAKNIASAGYAEQMIAANQEYWGQILREFEQNSRKFESDYLAHRLQLQRYSGIHTELDLQRLCEQSAHHLQLVEEIPLLS